ncbi:spore cortex biosynthesis protein YabQ [Butyricicoccus porcorum]|uniref:spore cortex biosynthesis protein YabQ n=1 Tax=Butyricicoccus porcorum TaxID=1945634 RepID=UPI0010543399|nr:spore cortex biosynthesis protein YabQ [Butyricicoccus porcorum]MCI6925939.1 spore cortex biosynthesis protein YabQ [Butyricicoccus porcorum]MDD6986493.1 spore cortex biosynthesis protein YabQ [Butyricicoccus porcorum]MDY4484039.1 spore cortex biosynthesis protein YabQ [Butyricicoccus porcorum]
MTVVNPLPEQLWTILMALLSGAACGAVYDVLREIRLVVGRRWLELLLDALFSVLVAAILFVLVAGISQMRLRGFMPVSMLAGGILWSATAGRLLRWLLRKCGRMVKTGSMILRGVCARFARPLRNHRKNREK